MAELNLIVKQLENHIHDDNRRFSEVREDLKELTKKVDQLITDFASWKAKLITVGVLVVPLANEGVRALFAWFAGHKM